MMTQSIVTLTKTRIPTIVCYGEDAENYVIGETARRLALTGQTNIWGFKRDLGESDSEFNKKKYWFYFPKDDTGEHRIETLSAKDATVEFLRQLLKEHQLPDQLTIGEPAVREEKWKENFRRHIREVFDLLNLPTPRFFPEPFAVFQYYREFEKIFSTREEPEVVLIIDYGGTTFNSCIIRTTETGHLARGGATAVPLGLQADLSGGYELDKALLGKAVQRARRKKVVWKEDPIARAESHPLVLLLTEDIKIKLSQAIGTRAKLSEDFSSIKEEVLFPRGTLHPDQEIHVHITGEDLKEVIQRMWRRRYGRLLISTVEEAKRRLKDATGVELSSLDKVLIAGGSSRLPFMREEIATVFPTLLLPQNIFIGDDLGTSVAFGIACECRDQARRNPSLKLNSIAPCLLNDLFLGFRLSRRDGVVPAKIKSKGGVSSDGRLLASPFETENLSFDFEFEFPHDIQERVFYCFSDRPFSEDNHSYLNVGSDVFLASTDKKFAKKAGLSIDIKKNGMCQPTFYLKEKGKGARKGPHIIQCPEFCLEDFKILEGSSFLGIDFGASNSYVARFVSPDSDSRTTSKYPEFVVGPATKESLRELEVKVDSYKQAGLLTREILLYHAEQQCLQIVFHSNKIEGIPLTLGETKRVLRGGNEETHLSENEKAARNLEGTYRWMLKHLDSWKNEPEGLIRYLNKSILEDIKADNGKYRSHSVALSGMKFSPPSSSSVPGFMQILGEELKRGLEDRSPLEFAASIHTKLVWIHPFADGNGRTARLLLNALLLVHGLPVIIVNFDDRERYLEALSESNDANLSALVTLFIEYVYEQLEQLDNQQVAIGPVTEPSVTSRADTTEDPIREAIEQVRVQGDDPLASAMETKILAIQQETEASYEAWKLSFLALRQEFKSIVEGFNSTTAYENAGFVMRLKEFDVLSFEQYSIIRGRDKVSRTWFLGFEIMGPRTRERFILFFGHSSFELCRAPNLNEVSLHIARSRDGSSNRLSSEPIRLREIGYCAGEIAFLRVGGAVQVGSVHEELKMLLADVIQAYF